MPLFILMDKIGLIQKITEIAEPIIQRHHLELVDVCLTTKSGKQCVQIFIDRPESAVNLKDCEEISNAVGEKFDEIDIIPESYILEVSSPGLDRKLKTEKDFLRFVGRDIKIVLRNPVSISGNIQGKFSGKLLGYANGEIEIQCYQPAAKIKFALSDIQEVRLIPDE